MPSQIPIRKSTRNKRVASESISPNVSKRIKETSQSIPSEPSLIIKFKLPERTKKTSQSTPSKPSLIVKFKLPISSATAATPDWNSDRPGSSALAVPPPRRIRACKSGFNTNTTIGNKKSRSPCGPAISLLGLPFGSPPAWANDRQPICETLEYYRAYQSSAYAHNGVCYGFLIDCPTAEGQYMDEEIIITQAGGACEMNEEGVRQQVKSQTYKSARIATFEKNMREMIPIGIIFGSKHALSLASMPHRYNVGAWFYLTAIWTEKNREHIVFMFRFQKVDLSEKSWWAPRDSPMPAVARDYVTKSPRACCIECRKESPQIYEEGWMCVSSEKCPNVGKIDGREPLVQLSFSKDFLNERTRWPAGAMPPSELVPSYQPHNSFDPHHTTSLAAWKGFVCPQCLCCNSRIEWDWERCQAEGCDYSRGIAHSVVPHLSVLPQNVLEVHGHAVSQNEYRGHVDHPTIAFLGHWRLITYKLCDDNYVTHLLANKHINGRPGGANDIFLDMQKIDSLRLKRSYMKNSAAQGRQLTRHFARNFGMPYNYIAAADSSPFSEAPCSIMESLNRLTWAGNVMTHGKEYPPRNELLAVGYMETQKMDYHDDGEKELDDLVSTWSLGAPGEMFFRIKKSYAHPDLDEATYNPKQEVVMGSDYWKERIALNNLCDAGMPNQFQQEKVKLFVKILEDKKAKAKGKGRGKENQAPGDEGEDDEIEPAENKTRKKWANQSSRKGSLPPWCLRLYLRHGDFVVMHGAKIHTAYEHAVVPSGKLRYAMTARYVKPELVDTKEHWRGTFTLPKENAYNGDLDLPIPSLGGTV